MFMVRLSKKTGGLISGAVVSYSNGKHYRKTQYSKRVNFGTNFVKWGN
jgi:hypothetical protein